MKLTDALNSLRGRVAGAWPGLSLSFAVLAVSSVVATFGSAALQRIVVAALINLVLVVGLYLFVGNSGVISFGHVSFAAVGAYAAGVLVIPLDMKHIVNPRTPEWLMAIEMAPLPATLIGGGLAFIVAVTLGVPLARVSGLEAGLATLAMLMTVRVVAENWESLTRGTVGLASVPTTVTLWQASAWAVIAIVVVAWFQSTRWGLKLKASREDPAAARALGIGIGFERWLTFGISGMIAGIGGALFVQHVGSVSPGTFYLGLTLVALLMLVAGGMKSLTGAVVGSALVSTIAELLRQVEIGVSVAGVSLPPVHGIRNAALGFILVVVLILWPRGVTGGREITWPFGRQGARRPPGSARATRSLIGRGPDSEMPASNVSTPNPGKQ